MYRIHSRLVLGVTLLGSLFLSANAHAAPADPSSGGAHTPAPPVAEDAGFPAPGTETDDTYSRDEPGATASPTPQSHEESPDLLDALAAAIDRLEPMEREAPDNPPPLTEPGIAMPPGTDPVAVAEDAIVDPDQPATVQFPEEPAPGITTTDSQDVTPAPANVDPAPDDATPAREDGAGPPKTIEVADPESAERGSEPGTTTDLPNEAELPVPPTTDVAPAPHTGEDADKASDLASEPRFIEDILKDGLPLPAAAPAPAENPAPQSARRADGFHILGTVVANGEFKQVDWSATETLSGRNPPTPVLIANGTSPGPVLCLTAAVHGDELNGIEAVRRVMFDIDPLKLRGTIIGVPIVNLPAFQRLSRYLPDRRDLNRFFPGNPRGSSAARIAHSLFSEVISHCNGLVDIHTGSFHRANLPQLRADLNNPAVVAFTQGFGSTVILHGAGGDGTLRRAATQAGIPAVTIEMGEPLRVQAEDVAHAEKGIFTLLDSMGMYARRSIWGKPEPVYYTSVWVRADKGGILSSTVKLGARVTTGASLGTVTDPISNEQQTIASPYSGRVIGMAVDQFVMPGYAAYHIGLEAPVDQVALDIEDADVVHDDPSRPASSETFD